MKRHTPITGGGGTKKKKIESVEFFCIMKTKRKRNEKTKQKCFNERKLRIKLLQSSISLSPAFAFSSYQFFLKRLPIFFQRRISVILVHHHARLPVPIFDDHFLVARINDAPLEQRFGPQGCQIVNRSLCRGLNVKSRGVSGDLNRASKAVYKRLLAPLFEQTVASILYCVAEKYADRTGRGEITKAALRYIARFSEEKNQNSCDLASRRNSFHHLMFPFAAQVLVVAQLLCWSRYNSPPLA